MEQLIAPPVPRERQTQTMVKFDGERGVAMAPWTGKMAESGRALRAALYRDEDVDHQLILGRLQRIGDVFLDEQIFRLELF